MNIVAAAQYYGVIGARYAPANVPGGFVFFPTKGDCVSGPISEVVVLIGLVLP